ncbi:MAG: SdrD B-like domain-containing protein [Planctomycetia bacterium]|nr:SdrD B-like domain-containing protein [Planctomycetia bacterium]
MKTSNNFTEKQAIAPDSVSDLPRRRKHRGLRRKQCKHQLNRICRLEELEKRELLAADPISVGAVYVEQAAEDLGDKFYIAWVGGENSTTCDTITINLDKNKDGQLSNGEAFFDTIADGGEGNVRGVYAASGFKLVEAETSSDIQIDSVLVEDGGSILTLKLSGFHSGDNLVFTIDVDEYNTQDRSLNNTGIVEGAEFGGSLASVKDIAGSWISASFTSTHYETENWEGMYLENFDVEQTRPNALVQAFNEQELPYDISDGGEGIWSAGLYDQISLTPKPILISGYVYADHDVDCNYDPEDEDTPLASVEVVLMHNGEQISSTKTDAEGYYEFGYDLKLMPGDYQVVCQTDVQSPTGKTYYDFCAKGGVFGEKVDPLHIDVGGMEGGDEAPDNNFSKVLPGAISGNVFEDRNDADNMESGEPGIANVEVELWKYDGTEWTYVESTFTNDQGAYRFEIDGTRVNGIRKNVNAVYQVREGAVPEEYSDGKDYIGSKGGTTDNDIFSNIEIKFGEEASEYNFGELKLGSISGNVYEDRNDNGIFSKSDEPGIEGVTVGLYQWSGEKYELLRTTTTDSKGFYSFTGLAIGYDYAVKETQPEEYSDGKDTIGSLGGISANDYFSQITILWDQHGTEYNFGELKLGSIEGNVYQDFNDDGIFDADEPGISNVRVGLYKWDGSNYLKIAETVSDERGHYIFSDLDINEEYAVKEEAQPDGFSDGKDAVGSLGGSLGNDELSSIEVAWDEHGIDYNFGELKKGSISGYVYADDNNDGVFDKTEKPIANTTVELYILKDGEYTKIAETKTNESGFYKFSDLDINQQYALKEIQPEGWDDGKDTLGTISGKEGTVGKVAGNDHFTDIGIKWDEHGINYNFGELAPPEPGKISGYVYVDSNDNGILEDGEKRIEGVEIILWQWDAVNQEYVKTGRTQTTDSNGYYRFGNLTPDNTYRVTEVQPVKYNDGKDTVGTLGGSMKNDDLYDIVVKSGEHGQQYNFGELEIPSETPPPGDVPYGNYTPTPSLYVPGNTYYSGSGPNFNYTFEPPMLSTHTVNYFGGGGLPSSYSWHLSVLNGGYPRSIEGLNSTAGYRSYLNAGEYVNVSFSANDRLDGGEWLIRGKDGSVASRYTFGASDAVPVVGDWNGNGLASIGIFVNGKWFLDRNGDGVWDEDDLWAEMGNKTDQPVVGDWDGDGKADIGVFGPQWTGDPLAIASEPGLPSDLNEYVNVSRPKNVPPEFNNATPGHRTLVHRNNGQLRLDLIDHVFEYGNEGDIAITGDWSGDGVSKIGVYRKDKWFLDINGNGRWDEGDVLVENFGEAGGIPVVADFNGDGIDEIGLFHNGKWSIDTNGDYRADVFFTFGQEGDKPAAADFDGDGSAEAAVYRSNSNVAVSTER